VSIISTYNQHNPHTKLQAVTSMIFQPKDDYDWSYAHHPHLAFFRDKWFAMWSNSRVNEDDAGQRVLLSSSSDFQNWSVPTPLIGPLLGEHSELVLTATGFHQYEEMLVAYVGRWEYAADHLQHGSRIHPQDNGHTRTGLYALTTTDGIHWSDPIDLHLPIVPNFGPQQLQSGRLILSGNIMFPYTDDPYGLTGWQQTGLYPEEWASEVWDDSEYIGKLQEKMGWPHMLCEGSFYETDDGTLHMLLRSSESKLWLTSSTDHGATWSAPEGTEFENDWSKFHVGRLPDGRFYFVGNPVPGGGRFPLGLSLSNDGMHFDQHYVLCDEPHERRIAGLHKSGTYAYPHSVYRDGHLHVIFSIMKEQIAVVRIPVGELERLND